MCPSTWCVPLSELGTTVSSWTLLVWKLRTLHQWAQNFQQGGTIKLLRSENETSWIFVCGTFLVCFGVRSYKINFTSLKGRISSGSSSRIIKLFFTLIEVSTSIDQVCISKSISKFLQRMFENSCWGIYFNKVGIVSLIIQSKESFILVGTGHSVAASFSTP